MDKEELGLAGLDFDNERKLAGQFLDNIQQITAAGPELLLGKIFDDIGFGRIGEDLFRQMVIARLCFPVSKLKTADYLSKYQFLKVDVQQIYRYLDKLYKTQKEKVQRISYEHTLKILKGRISVVFYDVTTFRSYHRKLIVLYN